MKNFSIETVIVIDAQAEAIGAAIRELRPDIEVLDNPQPVPEARFAIAAFAPGDAINRFSRAAWVHCTGAGTDKLFAALEFTPPVMTRTLGLMGEQIAEYVMAYVLADAQRIALRAEYAERAEWNKWGLQPRFLRGQRAVIFGTGDIGRTVAERLSAFGIKCDGVSASGREKAPFERVVVPARLADLTPAEFDIAVLALPNLPDTKNLIDAGMLAQFSEVHLINVGRGEVLDHDALLNAISARNVRQAVLDVFTEEPLPAGSPLWRHEGVVITPHVSGITRPEDSAAAFAEALGCLERGQTPPHPVDPKKGY